MMQKAQNFVWVDTYSIRMFSQFTSSKNKSTYIQCYTTSSKNKSTYIQCYTTG